MTRIRPFFLKVSWVFLTTWSRLCRTNAHVRGLTRPEMSSTPLSDLRFRARFMPLLCHACFHSFRALLRPCSFLDYQCHSHISIVCHETRGFRGLTVFRTSPHAASPPNPMKVVRQVHGKVKVDHMIYISVQASGRYISTKKNPCFLVLKIFEPLTSLLDRNGTVEFDVFDAMIS